jgi:hypothetical protein
MKYLKKIFEAEKSNDIILTMSDVRNLKHNLGYGEETDSFMKNYGWKEDKTLVAMPGWSGKDSQEWDGHKVEIYNLYSKNERYISELGYAILIDGKVEYLIGIYEPHGASLNAKRGLITVHGHEEIIKLWLDDGEFERTHTR